MSIKKALKFGAFLLSTGRVTYIEGERRNVHAVHFFKMRKSVAAMPSGINLKIQGAIVKSLLLRTTILSPKLLILFFVKVLGELWLLQFLIQ